MKTKFYFGAFAALALGFASCSSDDPINGPVDPDGPTVGDKYMAVVIQNIGSTGRALPGDTDFEGPANGSSESTFTADDIRFYFFTESGQPFLMVNNGVNGEVSNTNMVKPYELKTENTNGAEDNIEGYLVLGTPAAGYLGNEPAKVFCIVNPIGHDFEYYAEKSLDELKNEKVTYNIDKDAFSKFVMTNSTYEKGGKEIYYTDVTGCIESDPTEAKKNPARIYLERLAAKVRVKDLGTKVVCEKGTPTNPEKEFTIRGIDGKVKLDVELVGWELINQAKKTNAIKNITSCLTTAPFEDWNDETRHRSYWAITAAQADDDFYKNTFNIKTDAFALKSYDASKPTENIAYCYGNTYFADDVESVNDRTTNATAILVKGIVKKNGSTEALDLVCWGGDYFTTGTFKQYVIDAWNNEHNSSLTADKVTFVNQTSGGVTLKPNTWMVNVDGSNWSRFKDFMWWEKGVTSYYLNIKHTPGGKFGVVRNHIYDYKITDVIGLGIPGSEPENPEETTPTYLAAVVYCLNWRVVSNTTVLE